MNMLHACALGFGAAQLRALGKWHGLFQFFNSPAPTADIHAGAAVATKSRKGGKKKRELPQRLAVRQGPSTANLG